MAAAVGLGDHLVGWAPGEVAPAGEEKASGRGVPRVERARVPSGWTSPTLTADLQLQRCSCHAPEQCPSLPLSSPHCYASRSPKCRLRGEASLGTAIDPDLQNFTPLLEAR